MDWNETRASLDCLRRAMYGLEERWVLEDLSNVVRVEEQEQPERRTYTLDELTPF